MNYQTIKVDDLDTVRVIKFDNAAKLNVLSQLFFDEFDNEMERLFADTSVRVLVLTGNERVFSAGGDFRDMYAADYKHAFLMCERAQRSMEQLQNLDIPVVAALSGIVVGGGLEIALHCDIRFAADNVELRFPEVNMGLIPAAGGCSLLPRYLSTGNAAYYLLSGLPIPLQTAIDKGIIQQVFAPEHLFHETMAFANMLAQKERQSLAAIKKILISQMYENTNKCKNYEVREFSSVLQQCGKKYIEKFFAKKQNPK